MDDLLGQKVEKEPTIYLSVFVWRSFENKAGICIILVQPMGLGWMITNRHLANILYRRRMCGHLLCLVPFYKRL